jgi:hypothetical protein
VWFVFGEEQSVVNQYEIFSGREQLLLNYPDACLKIDRHFFSKSFLKLRGNSLELSYLFNVEEFEP